MIRTGAFHLAKSGAQGSWWAFLLGAGNYIAGDGQHTTHLIGMSLTFLCMAAFFAAVAFIKIGVTQP